MFPFGFPAVQRPQQMPSNESSKAHSYGGHLTPVSLVTEARAAMCIQLSKID